MSSTKHIIKFGEDVDGYSIPVLNEREIRASAGIIFLFMFIALMQILFNENFLMIKYVIIVFLSDLMIRIFINPKFSPTLIAARLIVMRQVPEYVAAAQKKFAWKIGIGIAGMMFLLLVIMNSYSIIISICCLVCLAFLFFESAFGICFGCIAYGWFYKQKTKYCAGEICEPRMKQDIQKTSSVQILILLCLLIFVTLVFIFFNHSFQAQPESLWKIIGFK